MSYLEILILRRLFAGPAHGYELRKRVEATTGFTLHNNTLYPALKRFEEAGAVTRTTEAQAGRPPRLIYQLTDTGRALLRDMLADLPVEQAADESEFMTRLGQFSLLSTSQRRSVLAARIEAVGGRLEHLREMRKQADEHGERWGVIVTDELARRAERELDWLAGLAERAEDEP
ncbi:MAG TPA: PadR family transcriptional regulator [Streptosporangiaceae bacterium]|nr:PadR family transcriptional regulator [Streptosporangiaceae bacterium]